MNDKWFQVMQRLVKEPKSPPKKSNELTAVPLRLTRRWSRLVDDIERTLGCNDLLRAESGRPPLSLWWHDVFLEYRQHVCSGITSPALVRKYREMPGMLSLLNELSKTDDEIRNYEPELDVCSAVISAAGRYTKLGRIDAAKTLARRALIDLGYLDAPRAPRGNPHMTGCKGAIKASVMADPKTRISEGTFAEIVKQLERDRRKTR
jgi:hypothetical protein